MKELSQHVYKFSDFEFDADRLTLSYNGELVKDAETKSLQVLAVLLEDPNELVLHDEIIDAVWGDNPTGVTAVRVNHYASRLQKLFVKYEPEMKFLENVRGRGYIFRGEVSGGQEEKSELFQSSDLRSQKGRRIEADNKESENHPDAATSPTPRKAGRLYLYLAVGTLVLAAVIGAWKFYPRNETEEVRKVVKESQLFESLVLYKSPVAFKEEQLDRYWTTELDLNTNYDRKRIRDAVSKLVREHRRYGDGTRCEQFDFQNVEINSAGDMAVVKTLEKWFVSDYTTDGALLKNSYIGPYFVSYVLRKVDGRWLIEKSTTARVNRPTPHLTEIGFETEAHQGQQFFVTLKGEDIEPEMVFLEVTGPGCPESAPCRVPNSALRDNAVMTANEMEHVPLTLAAGEFRIAARNGDSPAGRAVSLRLER
jgi:DNA-binding winged helix-turn-helix (wHTH) protein